MREGDLRVRFLCCGLGVAFAAAVWAKTEIAEVRVNGSLSPSIVGATPVVSYKLVSPKPGACQGLLEFLVYSPEENESSPGCVWRSPIFFHADGLMSEIVFTNFAFKSAHKYAIQLRVQDETGLMSEPKRVTLVTSLLEPDAWTAAKFIAPAEREIVLAKDVRHAYLYATGRGTYEPHVNGKSLKDCFSDPGYVASARRCYFVGADVTAFVNCKKGERNLVSATLGKGASFCGILVLKYRDGTEDRLPTDASWKGAVVVDGFKGMFRPMPGSPSLRREDETGALVTGDADVNRLVERVRDSLRAARFLPADGSQEWTRDAAAFAEAACYLADMRSCFGAWLADWRLSREESGDVSLSADDDSACVVLPWTLLRMAGSVQPIRENWRTLSRTVAGQSRRMLEMGRFIAREDEAERFRPTAVSQDERANAGDCAKVARLFREVAGIRTDARAPGFRYIVFKPTPDRRLGSVDATCDTVYGRVRSAWRFEGKTWIWDISVPPDAVAEVHVPGEFMPRHCDSGEHRFEIDQEKVHK